MSVMGLRRLVYGTSAAIVLACLAIIILALWPGR